MEASEQGLETQVTQETPPTEGGDTEKAPDDTKGSLSRLEQRMDALVDAIAPEKEKKEPAEGLSRYLDSLYSGADDPFSDLGDEDEGEGENTEEAGTEDDYDEDIGDDEELSEDDQEHLAARLAQIIDSRVQAGVKEAVEPFLSEQAQRQHRVDLLALEDKYPELKQPENAEPVLAAAESWAKRLGNPALAYQSSTLEMVYKALRAEEAAQQEKRAESAGREGSEVVLEGAGGANPGGGSGDDIADLIVKMGKPRGWPT